MEFFATARIHTNTEDLRRITIDRLPQFSPTIERLVTVHDDDHARAWTVWGEFDIVRLPVTGGVRFVLTDCANALTWSLTTAHPPQPDAVTVHATINRPEQDPEFVETIEGFVEEWREALEREFG